MGVNTLNNWSLSFLTSASVHEAELGGTVVGDVNGDGLDDVIVTAPNFLTDQVGDRLGFNYLYLRSARLARTGPRAGADPEADDVVAGLSADLIVLDETVGGPIAAAF